MPQNQTLQDAIKKLHHNNNKEKHEKAQRALDAIFAADPNDAVAFKAAVKAHKDFWKENGLVDEVDDLDNNGAPNFVDLYKQVAKQRVISRLGIHESHLVKFILDNPVELRRQLVVDPYKNHFGDLTKSKLPWDASNEGVISNPAAAEISLAAQTYYLESKLKASDDSAQLDALLQAIDDDDDAAFRRVLQNWQIPQPALDKMTTEGVGAQITHSLALKALEAKARLLASQQDQHNALLDMIQRNDDADFAAHLGAPYDGKVVAEDAKALRGVMGGEYLKARLNTEQRQDTLLQLAGMTILGDLQAALANEYGSQAGNKDALNQYIVEAVTQSTINSFRQAAASKALTHKIATMNDVAALEALARAKTQKDFSQVLETVSAFGLNTPAKKSVCEAFTNLEEIKKLSTIAHVRSNLLPKIPQTDKDWEQARVHADRLATLLDPAYTSANYAAQFLPANPKPEELQSFKDYFNDPARLMEARKMALAGLIPAVLKDADPGLLNGITAANDTNQLKRAVAAVLGHDKANDLIENDIDSAYNLKIRAYAQLYQMPQFLATQNYDELTAIVEADGWEGLPDLMQEILPGLSQNDTQNLEAELIQGLLRQYPANADLNRLVNLTKPNISEAEFKQALTGLNINRQDWVNASRMQAVQKVAAERAMIIRAENVLGIPLDQRPELKKVMLNLSPAKQASLAANAELISLLASRTEAEKIRDLLNDKHLNVDALVQENTNLGLFYKIHNSAIANTLKGLNVKLDPSLVRNINTYIDSKTTAELSGQPQAFADSVKQLWEILGRANRHIEEDAFNQAFGYNDDRSALNRHDQKNGISQQHDHNQELRTFINAANPAGKKRVADFMLGLSKNQPFTAIQLQELCKHLGTAKDRTELLRLITNDATLNGVMPPEFSRQLTESIYSFLTQGIKSDKYKDMSLEELSTAIDAGHLEVQKNLDKLHNLQKESGHSHLNTFSELQEALWLDPAFEGLSKTNAVRIEEDLINTKKMCDIVIPALKAHLALIEEQLKSLPDNDLNSKKAKAIAKEKAFLTKAYNEIKAELDMYLKIEDVLKGNPNASDERMQKGLLAAVEEAKKGEHTIRFTEFKVKVGKDEDIAAFDDLIKKEDGQRKQATYNQALQLDIGVAVKDYETEKKVPVGKVRPYILEHQTKGTDGTVTITTSTVLERRHSQDMAPKTSKGEEAYNPSKSLTLVPNKKRTEDQMAKDAIFMAMKALTGLAKAPDKDHPFLLTGDNADEVRLLYGALLAVGELHPRFKISEECIRMGTTAYVPPRSSVWSDPNYKIIKNHPEFKALTQGFSKMVSQQEKAQADLKRVEKQVTNSGNMYKTAIQDGRALKDLEQENANRPQSPSVGSP